MRRCNSCGAQLVAGENHHADWCEHAAPKPKVGKGKKYAPFSIKGCARCHGDGHDGLMFERLEHPIVDDDGTTWAWWAACPTNGQPILLREDAKVEPGVALPHSQEV